jgi:hypothetical protein
VVFLILVSMSLGMAVRRSGGEIPKKPIARQNDNAVEGSEFLEEVGRARHDFEALRFRRLTGSSCPPMMSNVGATAAGNSAADETGRCAWHGQIAPSIAADPI